MATVLLSSDTAHIRHTIYALHLSADTVKHGHIYFLSATQTLCLGVVLTVGLRIEIRKA